MVLSLLLSLCACTEYGFSKGSPADPEDTGTPAETDDRTGDSAPGPDSGGDSTAPPQDTGEPDVCYEPEDGYAQNAAARVITADAVTPITITFVLSDSDYDDILYLDQPESRELVRAWEASPGVSLTVGPYASSKEVVFGIDVLDTGMHWQSGPSSRNSDGVTHVAVTYEGGCSWLIGFEDLTGGGDLDFNDVVLRVQGRLRQED